ncbi:MAG TPA: ComEC/Rec2 family competence protein [bacterium]|nr:ComEC/Rec2 family competence protein [bacterium]HPN31061.1 ComEC/Rec2 family competence protein [bacterium]
MEIKRWIIDPQIKIGKTRILYKGSEKKIQALKESLPQFKSSDVYPVMTGNFDFQLFFYTVDEKDISEISIKAFEILGKEKGEPEKPEPGKNKNIILSGLIAAIILVICFAGYKYYNDYYKPKPEVITAAQPEHTETGAKQTDAAAEQPQAEVAGDTGTEESIPETIEKKTQETTGSEDYGFEVKDGTDAFGRMETVETDKGILKESAGVSGKKLKIIYADVGQGDAQIIITPSKKCFVIDTGKSPKDGDKIADILKKNKISKISILVLTHPHKDHIEGTLNLMDKIKIEKIYDSGHPATTRTYKEILKQIKRRNIGYETPKRGDEFKWDKDISVKILHPEKGKTYDNVNNASIVIRMKYKQNSFLFTGDVEAECEKEIAKKFGSSLKADVLKAGHHGSKTSSSQEFLDKIKPNYCVIQVGAGNKFHHPHPSTYKRLKKMIKHIYRTDEDGDIEFTSNGNKIEAQNKN